MPEGDGDKAAKVAAARKRVEELKRQKAKKAATVKSTPTDTPSNEQTNTIDAPEATSNANATADEHGTDVPDEPSNCPDSDPDSSSTIVSKSRSESFRRTSVSASGTLLSPTGAKPDSQAMSEIYRRQTGKLEELEKENKRLQKEVEAGNSRWQRLERELEDLRDKDARKGVDSPEPSVRASEEMQNLQNEIEVLKRRNSQLQSSSKPRSMSTAIASPDLDRRLDLEAKNKTIQAMETELSNSRLELQSHVENASRHQDQIQALETKLDRAEKAGSQSQSEVADLRKALTRLTEKTLKEGTQVASVETKVRSLERELENQTRQREDDSKRIAMLEAKLNTLTNLQKESEARRLEAEKAKRVLEIETIDLRRKLQDPERGEQKRQKRAESLHKSGANGDDKFQELESDDRYKLESRIRELEAELTEVKRGVWRDRRRELQPQLDSDHLDLSEKFDSIDLSGRATGGGPSVAEDTSRNYNAGPTGVGLVSAITNSIMNFTNAEHTTTQTSLIDDDFEFDSEAFVKAREDEAKERLARIRETKRSLLKWKGSKLDLVQQRLGGESFEVFEI